MEGIMKLCKKVTVFAVALFVISILAVPQSVGAKEAYQAIYSANDLADIPDGATGNYILMNDIDLGGTEENNWKGIANFKGVFDGNGHTISGLYITSEDGETVCTSVQKNIIPKACALFTTTGKNAVIKNFSLNGTIHMKPLGDYLAAYSAGVVYENLGEISNVSCILSVSGNDIGRNANSGAFGGVASINHGLVSQCSFTGTIENNAAYIVGGIVGDNCGVVTDCQNYGVIKHNAAYDSQRNYSYIGGIVGCMRGDAFIVGCDNYGELILDTELGMNAGGIAGCSAGQGNASVIINSKNHAKISVERDFANTQDKAAVGAIVGEISAATYGAVIGAGTGTVISPWGFLGGNNYLIGCENTENGYVVINGENYSMSLVKSLNLRVDEEVTPVVGIYFCENKLSNTYTDYESVSVEGIVESIYMDPGNTVTVMNCKKNGETVTRQIDNENVFIKNMENIAFSKEDKEVGAEKEVNLSSDITELFTSDVVFVQKEGAIWNVDFGRRTQARAIGCMKDGSIVLYNVSNKDWSEEAVEEPEETPDNHTHEYILGHILPATTKTDGKIVNICNICGNLSETPISRVKSIVLEATEYSYNGKERKPSVAVKDANGNVIDAGHYVVTYQNHKKVGTANVKVKFNGKHYSGEMQTTFVINPKATSISKLTAKSKGFTIKIKKQSKQTSGYQIRYSTKKNMRSARTIDVKKSSKTSVSVKKLKAKKKYYVQVRTYKKVNGKKYYSKWSAKKAVTTKR